MTAARVDFPLLAWCDATRAAVIGRGHRHVAKPQTGDIKITTRRDVNLIVTAAEAGTLWYGGTLILRSVRLAEIDEVCAFINRLPQVNASGDALNCRDVNVAKEINLDLGLAALLKENR